MFNVIDWYWSGSLGIYSSARGALVSSPETDTAYNTWLRNGTRNPTTWPCDDAGAQTPAALDDVLILNKLPPTGLAPVTTASLIAYAAQKRFAVETGGITVNGVLVDTSRESQSMIANANAYVAASGVTSVAYKANSGWVTLDAATVKNVALAIGWHVQAAFTTEQAINTAITAGTITTFAQIDAYAWTE